MLIFDDIKVEFESQGFKGTHLGTSPQKDKTVMFLESIQSTETVRCPACGAGVYIYENYHVNLKDIPLWKGVEHSCSCLIHRCSGSGKVYDTERMSYTRACCTCHISDQHRQTRRF